MNLFNSLSTRWTKGGMFGHTGYKIIDIKAGGMAIVYIIAHPLIPSEVWAVKTFKDEFTKEESVVKRFWFEAQKWLELERHENLVYADQVFEVEGKPYIYLEFIDGGNLRSLMQRQRLQPSQVLDLVLQFCTGMEAVRKTKGLLHRDVKPENCLITSRGTLKITDWGLAKIFDEVPRSPISPPKPSSIYNATLTMTKAGAVMGTPLYMSPEQWEGEKVDLRSDIYSFGCMLYEMLSNRFPFDGTSLSELQIKHLTDEPEIIRNVPDAINTIVMKCLQKRPEDRFNNFEEIGEEILKITGRKESISQRAADGWRPMSSEELTQKGFGLLHLRRDIGAIRYFEKAARLDSNNFKAWGYMGYCLSNINEHEKAIQVSELAIKINPRFAHAYGNLGYSYAALKQFEKAIENHKKAIQLAPQEIPNYNNLTLAFLNYGDATQDGNKYREGLYYVDLGLKIDNRYYRLWISRGHFLQRLKNYQEAIDSYSRALAINPRAYQAAAGLYQCYNAIGDTPKAKKYADLALQIDPNFTT